MNQTDRLSRPDTPPLLQVAGLGKSYGALRALGDVSLTVAAGERLVILGALGSGRSALLRCVAGLEAFQEGEVLLQGKALPPDARTRDGQIGLVAPETGLPPQSTVIAVCSVGAGGAAPARAVLVRLGLANAADHPVAALSMGRQRLVAIARALACGPAVMLLDEPTSGLEPEDAAEMRDVLALLADDGVTMICTTDDLALARRVADRVVFMDRGRVVETGTAARFLAGPQSSRAQTYLAALG